MDTSKKTDQTNNNDRDRERNKDPVLGPPQSMPKRPPFLSHRKASSMAQRDHAHGVWKGEKRQKVKDCLNELKSLVSPEQGRGSTGTLSALQTVISHMRKLKGEIEQNDGNASPESSRRTLDLESARDSDNFDLGKKPHKIVMSMKDHIVSQVDDELLIQLGYPKKYWLKQSLMEFVCIKDIMTLSSHISVCRETVGSSSNASADPQDPQLNNFFFRLRQYKGLRHGYSLGKQEKYTVMYGQLEVKPAHTLTDSGMSSSPVTPGMNAPTAEDLKNQVVLKCVQVKSGYLERDRAPEKNLFITRQTVFLNYNFISMSAIPLLGYLPQDMVGKSVFDYYHPDDLPYLLTAYEEVLSKLGQTIKSKPYKMRVRNGDYIVLQTEWASFVNPWTKRLDFIMGHHRVISPPKNLDIFSDSILGKRKHVGWTPQAEGLKRQIVSLVLESARPREVVGKRIAAATVSRNPVHKEVESANDESGFYEKDYTGSLLSLDSFAIAQREEEQQTKKVSTEPNPPIDIRSKTDEPNANGLLFMYDQLNYANNIRKFLSSCHKAESSIESKKSDEGKEAEFVCRESNCESDPESIPIDVGITIPHPPSYASSTKPVISEQEPPEDVMPPSPQEDSQQEHTTKEADEDNQDQYKPVRLTQDVLKMHNRMQEEHYLQNMMRDSSSLLLAMARKNIGSGSVLTKQKRKDSEATPGLNATQRAHLQEQITRTAKPGEAQTYTAVPTSLMPPFKLSAVNLPAQTTATSAINMPEGNLSGMTMAKTPICIQPHLVNSPAQMPNTVGYYQPTFSLLPLTPQQQVQAIPQVITDPRPREGRNLAQDQQYPVPGAVGGLQWPYYPQTGLSFVPQVIGGFYQSFPGIVHAVHAPTIAEQGLQFTLARGTQQTLVRCTSSGSKSSVSIPQKEGMREPLPNVTEMKKQESSTEETSSSALYLLESSGVSDEPQGFQITPRRRIRKRAQSKICRDPPWLQNVNVDESYMMRYQLPKLQLRKTIKETRQNIYKYKQPPQVAQQMNEILQDRLEGPIEIMHPEDDDRQSLTSVWPESHHSTMRQDCPAIESESEQNEINTSIANEGHANMASLDEVQMDDPLLCCTGIKDTCKDVEKMVFETTDNLLSCDKKSPESMDTDEKHSSVSEEDEIKSKLDKPSPSPGKGDMESDSSETGSSKGSSDLTPSDQRSNEEANSSLKESDNASSHSGNSANISSKEIVEETSAELEPEMKTKKLMEPMDELFKQLFVPIHLVTQNKSSQSSTDWEESQAINKKIIMENDKKKLEKMAQSSAVIHQLAELMEELSEIESQASSVTSPGCQGNTTKEAAVSSDAPGSSNTDQGEISMDCDEGEVPSNQPIQKNDKVVMTDNNVDMPCTTEVGTESESSDDHNVTKAEPKNVANRNSPGSHIFNAVCSPGSLPEYSPCFQD